MSIAWALSRTVSAATARPISAKITSYRSIRCPPIKSRSFAARQRCATDRSRSAAWSVPATIAFPIRCPAARCPRSRPTDTRSPNRNCRRRTPAPVSKRVRRYPASISDAKVRCCSMQQATTWRSMPMRSRARQKTTAFRTRLIASIRRGHSPASNRTPRRSPTARRLAVHISSQAASSALPFSRTTAYIISPEPTAKTTARASAHGRPS